MADNRCGYVSLNNLISSLQSIMRDNGLSGEEPVTDSIVIDSPNNPEYALGTVVFRIKDLNERDKYGTISVVPRKLSEKLN